MFIFSIRKWKSPRIPSLALFLMVFSLASISTPASAQHENEEPIDEIIVTALKRGDQSLVDAAAGVTVISGQFIDDSGADSLADLLSMVPATSIDSEGAGTTNIQIRGVNATFGAASVGYYIDGLPFSMLRFNLLLDSNPYDLDSIEVLRGPQGTLYGAGSAGGVVVINTADPEMNELQGKVRVTGSDTAHGGGNYGVAGAINIPLVDDRLAARATASIQNNSGWIDGSIIGRTNINDEDRQNFRFKALAQLSDNFDATLLANIIRIDAGMDILSDDSGLYTDDVDQSRSNESNHYGVILNYESPWFHLQNSTSYIDFSLTQTFAVNAALTVPTLNSVEILANELRLNSVGNGNVSWVAGLFFRDADELIVQDTSDFGTGIVADSATSKQLSIYGNAIFEFHEGWADLSLGISYFQDEIGAAGEWQNMSVVQPSHEADLWSPKITLAIHPRDSSTVYLTYAEGFRSTIYDSVFSTFAVQQIDPTITGHVRPEKLKSFEVGAKAEFVSGTVYGELALFYTDIEDTQQSAAIVAPGGGGPRSTLLNAGDAVTQGVEALLSARLMEGLDMTLAASYTKAEFVEDFFAPGSDPSTDTPLFADGGRLTLVPELIFSGSLSYGWAVGKTDLDALGFLSVQYTSDRALTILQNPPIVGDDITRVDARIEIGRYNWAFFIFGENLTDDYGAISPSQLQIFFDLVGQPYDGTIGTRLRPRTIGVGFRYGF